MSGLQSFVVSSDFDAKEMVSRNLMRILGPFSQPAAILDLQTGPALEGGVNATIAWIDPVNWLADLTELQILETAQVMLIFKPKRMSTI
jgi:Xylosyltransferase C terminal